MRAQHLLAHIACFPVISTLGTAQVGAEDPGGSAGIEIRRDVAFLPQHRTERMDLYLPEDRVARPVPAVLLIHGGGWHKGDKADARERGIASTLAAHGFACASINYVLGGEGKPAPWPENLKDCRDGVRYLRAHAQTLGIDPEHIGVMGSSAGGHLASMVGVVGDEASLASPHTELAGVSSRVQAVIDLYGPADFLTRRDTDQEGNPLESLRDGPIPILLGVGRDEGRELWKFASPTTHASEDDPPFLILHGKADRTVDYMQSTTLAQRLRAAGVDAELLLIEGAGHSFDLRSHRKGRMPGSIEPRVLAFLRRHLMPHRADGSTVERWHHHAGTALPYRWFAPSHTDAPQPLVVFLHGAGERGYDNRAQLKWGVARFVDAAAQAQHPCLLVAPQCPPGKRWTDDDIRVAVRDLVHRLAHDHPVDRSRIYITGLSMGGFGTWQAIARDPDLYAAAVPICGGGEADRVVAAADLPIWAFHGADDRVVPPKHSRDLIDALRAAGGAPNYTEYEGVGHNSWSAAYADPELHRWLFAQVRPNKE